MTCVNVKNRPDAGFTLIELVMVIVILGVLAAVAIPKFVNLRTDATAAATLNLEGAVRTTASNMRLKCATTPGCNMTSGVSYPVFGGRTYRIWRGWLDAGDNLNNNEIDVALDHAGFTASLVSNLITRFTHRSATTPSACYVNYQEPLSDGADPVISSNVTGC